LVLNQGKAKLVFIKIPRSGGVFRIKEGDLLGEVLGFH
jgi:hypothetical protein